ncbi:MAG: glycosyltransferase [Flavobacteriaceae bacterium]|nr:glycosyltransferase [Flavobacteriaceae bacterium]
MNKEKIQLIIASANLLPGGAERVLSFLATHIDKEVFDVTLVIFGFEKDVAYDIDGIKAYYFNKTRIVYGSFRFFKVLKREKPDLVITAVGHLNTMAAFMSWFFPKTKFVAREVSINSVISRFTRYTFHPLMWLGKYRFRFLDAVICQSNQMVEDIRSTYTVDPDKITVIPNPVTHKFKLKQAIPDLKEMKLITVGRISGEKGLERLVNLLKRLEFPFHYTLIGNGPDREKILNLIAAEGLNEQTTYIEYTAEVGNYLSDSHVFLQGSYSEGFPNAVLESAAVGTPVVAYAAPGGLVEIIEDDVNGYIVDTEDEFVERLNALYKDYKFKPEPIRESVMRKFKSDIVLKKYEDLFKDLVATHS